MYKTAKQIVMIAEPILCVIFLAFRRPNRRSDPTFVFACRSSNVTFVPLALIYLLKLSPNKVNFREKLYKCIGNLCSEIFCTSLFCSFLEPPPHINFLSRLTKIKLLWLTLIQKNEIFRENPSDRKWVFRYRETGRQT
jgi:hypothetical protein